MWRSLLLEPIKKKWFEKHPEPNYLKFYKLQIMHKKGEQLKYLNCPQTPNYASLWASRVPRCWDWDACFDDYPVSRGGGGQATLLHSAVSRSFQCTLLHCTALHTIAPCSVMPCSTLPCTVLHCTVLPCTTLPCTALPCTVLQCTLQHCTVESH